MTPQKFFLISLLLIVMILFVIIGVWLTINKLNGAGNGDSEYSAVYLANGDTYFGKLVWFPQPRLKNVWMVQKNVTASDTQLSIVPFKNIFWRPVDEIYLNPSQVMFTARLRSDSQISQAIHNSESQQ